MLGGGARSVGNSLPGGRDASLRAGRRKGLRVQWSLMLMLVPGFVLVLIYHYGPLVGLSIAFQRYDIAFGFFNQQWVGFDNFRYIFGYPGFWRVIWNTLFISVMKWWAGMLVPICVSVLLNEMIHQRPKRTIQTLIYLPHFISWIVISGVFIDLLSPSVGAINGIIKALGFEPVYFLGNKVLFPYVLVVTDVWKTFGFGTIIYLAALSGIDPNLYEAAQIDGARRFQKIRYITLPGIVHIMVLVAILNLGGILNAGFEQVFNMYNPLVYETGDIIDTLTYRIGIVEAQYDLATAIGLFKSSISLVMVSTSYYIAYRFAGYRIF
jgi:putative aldouronate transport system permease protein